MPARNGSQICSPKDAGLATKCNTTNQHRLIDRNPLTSCDSDQLLPVCQLSLDQEQKFLTSVFEKKPVVLTAEALSGAQ